MAETNKKEKMNIEGYTESRFLRRKSVKLLFGLLITLIAVSAATFAWYIYNTNAHTTKVHMAAGTSKQLVISDAYDGEYSSSIALDSFKGTLNPVSTDCISNGFQKVYGFTDGSEVKSKLANLFGPAESSDYFSTTLFIKTNSDRQSLYVSAMEYDDSNKSERMATAMRVGLVVHKPGEDQEVYKEYIFELSTERNPNGYYNTQNGYDGCVLDSTVTDGSGATVDFSDRLLNDSNFVGYNSSTGTVSKGAKSKELCEVTGGGSDKMGTPVQIDVYLWLEGCDADCAGDLGGLSLRDFAISFAGYDK